MVAVAVRCEGSRSEGWSCHVTIRESGLDISNHEVRVGWSDLQRLAPDASEPSALVNASFTFLLERESPQMIRRSFDLLDIARYFPDYETTIRHMTHAT
jgi:hypothetical protein